MNSFVSWLLRFEGYPPGVVISFILHGILLYILLPKEFEPAEQVRIEPMSFVVASAVKESPQQKRLRELNTQRQNQERERERQRQEDVRRQQQAEAEKQRQVEAERQREAEAEQRRIAQQQQQQREEEERQRQQEQERERQREEERRQQQLAAEQSARDAAARRAAEEAQAQQQSVENQMVAQYQAIIRDLISGAWSRPPSARNGMLAVVNLRLTPTGEIISRDIVRSSGDGSFDRSVLQAVDRVGSFPELKDMPTPIFERNFRTINLEFSPEDLLR